MEDLSTALLLFPAVAFVSFPPAAAGDDGEKINGKGARIVIVGMEKCCPDEAWVEAEKKAQEEFQSLHFDVIVVDGWARWENERRLELEIFGKENDAVCSLRILRAPQGPGGTVEIWIGDSAKSKGVTKSLSVKADSEADAASIIALRVWELLRFYMFELFEPTASEKPEAGAPPPAAADAKGKKTGLEGPAPPKGGPRLESTKPAPPPKRAAGFIGLRAGIEALGSPGGPGAMGAVEAAVRWRLAPSLSIEVGGMMPFAGGIDEGSEVQLVLRAAAVRLWSFWEAVRRSFVVFSVGAGAGMIVAWSRAVAPEDAPQPGPRTGWTGAGYVGGSVQLALALSKHVWLRTGFIAGASVPAIEVLFDGKKIAGFGAPMLEGFLGLEIKIP